LAAANYFGTIKHENLLPQKKLPIIKGFGDPQKFKHHEEIFALQYLKSFNPVNHATKQN